MDLEHELLSAENEGAPSADEMEGELETLRAERASFLDRLARLQAEFDNYRKRSVKEQQDFRDYALADALKSLLPILDSLDRALKTDAVSLQDFRSGIELIDKQFHANFRRGALDSGRGRGLRSQSSPSSADGGNG